MSDCTPVASPVVWGVPVQTGALAGIDQATLRLWLATAQTTYATLVTGGKPVTVSYSQGAVSRSVTYAAADRLQLQQWIAQLQRALGLPSANRRPMRPFFR